MVRHEVALKKTVRLECYNALEQTGFTRFAKEGVDRPLSDGFNCWVGLNSGVYSDLVEINPFVGLHVVPLEKLAASIKGRKYDRRIATYAVPMGELEMAREEQAFAFTSEQSASFIASEAQRLARLYETAGVDFAASIASYEKLLPLLKERLDMLGGYPESVACCLYLMGKEGEAAAFVRDFAVKEPSYFSGFAASFLKMCEDGGQTEGQ
jgi:hypothetical protein